MHHCALWKYTTGFRRPILRKLIANPHHNTLFLPGDDACALGVKAGPGYRIRHVILSNLPNWRTSVPAMKDRHICALSLIFRKALSEQETNGKTLADVVLRDEMIELMETEGMGFYVNQMATVARTTYTPIDPYFNTLKQRTYLWQYSEVLPISGADTGHPTFIVSGVTDHKPGGYDSEYAVSAGQPGDGATTAKSVYVVDELTRRIGQLELKPDDITQAHVYTSGLNHSIIRDHLTKAFPSLRLHGLTFIDAHTFYQSSDPQKEPPKLTIDVSAGDIVYERWNGEGNETGLLES